MDYWNYVNDIRLKNNVMSHNGDLLAASHLIKLFNKQKFLELGTGGGGWPLTVLEICPETQNIEWILLDNFSWIKNNNIDSHAMASNWKKNYNDLKINLSRVIKKVHVIDADADEFIDNPQFSLIDNLDILRIDCRVKYDTIDKIIDVMSNENFIFIDDIRLNCGMERVKRMFYLINKGYYPIWIGEKETCLHNVKSQSTKFAIELAKILKNLDESFTHPILDGSEHGVPDLLTCYTLPHPRP